MRPAGLYAGGMPGFAKPWMLTLPLLYESTGIETRFTTLLDPEPRSRRVFAFHRPETRVGWVQAALAEGKNQEYPAQRQHEEQDRHGEPGRHKVDPYGRVAEDGVPYDAGNGGGNQGGGEGHPKGTGATLAGRLPRLPVSVEDPKLWPAQQLAIANLERSLRGNKPRALIQMATGSGKTFTAISAIYRLIRYADARRRCFGKAIDGSQGSS